MTKFGAALALGIIDAGGRNCTIGLQTQTGNLNMAGIVGMAVFTQYWYWFPFTHFLSLAFSPTSVSRRGVPTGSTRSATAAQPGVVRGTAVSRARSPSSPASLPATRRWRWSRGQGLGGWTTTTRIPSAARTRAALHTWRDCRRRTEPAATRVARARTPARVIE